jgi:hypothetical protein
LEALANDARIADAGLLGSIMEADRLS